MALKNKMKTQTFYEKKVNSVLPALNQFLPNENKRKFEFFNKYSNYFDFKKNLKTICIFNYRIKKLI